MADPRQPPRERSGPGASGGNRTLWTEVARATQRDRGSVSCRFRSADREAEAHGDGAGANAREEFARHRLKRHSDHNAQGQGHAQPPGAPRSSPDPPLAHRVLRHLDDPGDGTPSGRWWCSRTPFPRKSDYRRIQECARFDGQDDFAAMEEVLRRRFHRLSSPSMRPPHGGTGQVRLPTVAGCDRRRAPGSWAGPSR